MNKSEYIGCYSMPDGYNGSRINAYVLLFNNRLIYAFAFGILSSCHLPMDISDKEEAIWMIENHPHGKEYFK